jgi:di/tripeptidase
MSLSLPTQSAAEIAAKARTHLEAVLAIESSSDEESDTIPSTAGQAQLAQWLQEFFEGQGAQVERDEFANMIASLPGRGTGASADPLALMVHLDTAKGTLPIDQLQLHANWDGGPLQWHQSSLLQVDLETFPSLESFLGQDLLHGPGIAPFGLDDKLGLTHLMTLAWLLKTNQQIDHPPLFFIGRPDEEIGRDEALHGLAALLQERGVQRGYTVDGIAPFEVNLENFNAAGASLLFESQPYKPEKPLLALDIRGINTHGATAKAEGHRSALRFVSELVQLIEVRVVYFETNPLRECDGVCVVETGKPEDIRAALDRIIAPHRCRGASWKNIALPRSCAPDLAADEMIRFVSSFLQSAPGFTLLAENSEGHDGYSHPYRSTFTSRGQQLDIRVRDFSTEGLSTRLQHLSSCTGNEICFEDQYTNMGPQLAHRPELVEWPQLAARSIGQEAPIAPIRGGTGVDPFLDADICVGNLGTGYFAPESEKELTSLQMLSEHASWLVALVQVAIGLSPETSHQK